ncbi:GyrI-like domain-containing protein [Spirillospora sp. CA-253888]
MNWYQAADDPEIVEFGPVRGLAVSGRGEPGGAEHGTAVRALYAVAGAAGLPPAPLEGRWWVEDDRPPLEVPRDEWRWHLFLRVPDDVAEVDAGRAGPGAAARVQLVTFTEGRCVQMLHRGPFEDEPRSLARMDAFIRAEGLVHHGLHHEIYLTDFRETDPDAQLTILRQPVRAA